MIGALREWITSIVMVTLLLSVVQTMVPEGTVRKIAAFTGGLILLLALLRPLLAMDLEGLKLDLSDYERAIQNQQEALAEAGETELAELIAARTAAYISDKANSLGQTVEVRVETEIGPDGLCIPSSAELTGTYSQELAAWIERELGIRAERQVWHEREN